MGTDPGVMEWEGECRKSGDSEIRGDIGTQDGRWCRAKEFGLPLEDGRESTEDFNDVTIAI